MSRNTGPSQRVRNAVIFRDNFSCRRCGATPGSQIHHRAPRGRWGIKNAEWVNGMAALVLLCIPCHTHVESHRTEALENGWLVRRNSQDLPEEIPMVDVAGRIFTLDDLGGVTYVTTGMTS